jgi:hypothetical protein
VSVTCHFIIVDGRQKAYVNAVIIIIIIIIRKNSDTSSCFKPINTVLSSNIQTLMRVFRTGCCGKRLDYVGRKVKKIA